MSFLPYLVLIWGTQSPCGSFEKSVTSSEAQLPETMVVILYFLAETCNELTDRLTDGQTPEKLIQ